MKRAKFVAIVGGRYLLHFDKSKLASHMDKSWQHAEARAIKLIATGRKSWRVASAHCGDHAFVKDHIAAINGGLTRHRGVNARVHQGHGFLLRLRWNLIALRRGDCAQRKRAHKSKNYFC